MAANGHFGARIDSLDLAEDGRDSRAGAQPPEDALRVML
ncbi:hypothetical protein MY1884_007723 [Beauveria asiatica]